MCKACKMDPREMRTYEIRKGAVEPEDFYEETNYQKRVGKPKDKRTRPGCPENDGKRHITGWVVRPEGRFGYEASDFYDFFGFYKYEYKVCLGCGKYYHGTRLTQEYKDRFGDRKYSVIERQDAAYIEFLRKRHRPFSIYF